MSPLDYTAYLLAPATKPITATAVCLAAERLGGRSATGPAIASDAWDPRAAFPLQLPTADARVNSPSTGQELRLDQERLTGVARAHKDGDNKGWLGNLLSHPYALESRSRSARPAGRRRLPGPGRRSLRPGSPRAPPRVLINRRRSPRPQRSGQTSKVPAKPTKSAHAWASKARLGPSLSFESRT